MTPDQQQRWRDVVEAQRRADVVVAQLKVPEVVPILRAVLAAGGPRLDYAVQMIKGLPEERRLDLFPDLYRATLAGHPDGERVLDVLGELDAGWLAFALGPEVQRTLAEPDIERWKRLEDLLDHLGQEDLLTRVRDAIAAAGAPPSTAAGQRDVAGAAEPGLTPDEQRYWTSVISATDDVIAARARLEGPDAVAVLREVLNGPDRETAQRFAWHLSSSELQELLPQLYEAATVTHRSILTTRQLIGRLDRAWLAEALAPLVERSLAQGDDEEYRRLAELLDHLGQYRILARLVEVAGRSDDEDIREVAEDFADGIPLPDS